MSKARVFIAVPSTRNSIKSKTAIALSVIAASLAESGIFHIVSNIDGARIDLVRNLFASLFLQDSQNTHLLFLDSDMEPTANTILDLFKADKPVVAAACVKRTLNLSSFAEYSRKIPHAAAMACASEFNFDLLPDQPQPTKSDRYFPVRRIGTGVALFKREAFELFIRSGIVRADRHLSYADKYGLTAPLFGFFDQIVMDGELLGEDQSFCERYRSIGGEITALLDCAVGHIGDFTYRANFTDRL